MRARVLALQALGLAAATIGGAQRPKAVRPDSVTVVADSTFARGGLGRWLLGDTYRDLWTAPVRVEVLDLARFAGGLTPLETGGRLQTRSLRFQGADGNVYQFRLVQKQLNPVWWEGFEGSLAGNMAQDQLSALHPAGALVVPALLEAARVPHVRPVLRVLPDDPRLGEFRAEFGNRLGFMEVRADGAKNAAAVICDAVKVEDTKGLLESLRKDPLVRVDTRLFLAARLIDLMIGDWDRHEDQYHWALIRAGEQSQWHPVPRDRDYAFATYDGALLRVGGRFSPGLLVYEEPHASPADATYRGRPFDRRILNDLSWPAWHQVTQEVQSKLTDSVIDRAVAALPPEYEKRNGAHLRRVLRSRRDSLLPAARSYYEYLADNVRVDAGDTDDWVDVQRHADGRTAVRVGRKGDGAAYYDRTFVPDETKEVRVFLRAGADRVRIQGDGPGPVVRVISGEGDDTLTDRSRAQWVRFYDDDAFTAPNGERVDGRPYVSPDTNPEIPQHRDFGRSMSPVPRVQISSHSGLALGLELRRSAYGFRSHPYASLYTASVDYSFRRNAIRLRGGARWHRENSQIYYGVAGLVSGIEGGRFFGYGNTTTYSGSSDRFITLRQAYELSPYVGFGLESRTRLWLMLRARHTMTDMNDATNRVSGISLFRPPGTGDAGKLGPAVRFELDSRDTEMAPTSGVLARIDADFNPVTWDNGEGPFGSIEGMVATYLSPFAPGRVSVAVRVGGRQVWGEFPYFESAFIGGNRSLRGYPSGRFAGDRALYGNTELRLKLLDNRLFLPVEIGLLGLADAGRVWFRGESDGSWHKDFGAGIWLSVLERSQGLSVGFAKGDERHRLWFTLGMPF